MPNLMRIADQLVRDVNRLSFGPPVAYVYNPLAYARKPFRRYLQLYGQGRKEVLFVGMNPGPWGMAQTGIPFGDVVAVREFLGIDEPIDKPPREHPKRPVDGLQCHRREVSGKRFWGWVRDRWKAPERFFAKHFVFNYCPLAFLEETGRNRTPDKLPLAERQPLAAACDKALVAVIKQMKPGFVIGIGRFAEDRIRACVDGSGVEVGRILHPSPASPLANGNWAAVATRQLRALGIDVPR